MKSIAKLLLLFSLPLILFGCITEKTPDKDRVRVNSGETQTFSAVSDDASATLVWSLDGEQVASGTNEYVFEAETNTSEEPVKHLLVVREENATYQKHHSVLGLPKNIADSEKWIIEVLPSEVRIGYMDSDGDGYGDPDNPVEYEGSMPDNVVSDDTDCDDTNADINPGAEEIPCNGVDENCDPSDDCQEQNTYYEDADGDGYGNPEVSQTAATAPEGFVEDNTDCDDGDSAVNPGAQEVCNGFDDDCDGEIDEGVKDTFYADADGDGYGDAASSTTACTAPEGYVENADDCDDTNADINPGAEEIPCNGVDENCDPSDDCQEQNTYYEDADGDGYGNPEVSQTAATAPEGFVEDNTDCDDGDSAVNPGAQEVCNGFDDDCDGQIDEGVLSTFYADADGDGFGDPGVSEQACDAPQGYVADNTDCDDSNAEINPSAEEVCNQIDDNCNGEVDEGLDMYTYFADVDGDGFGDPSSSTETCQTTAPEGYVDDAADCDDTNAAVNPDAVEVCDNGIDDDCNDLVDSEDPECGVTPATNVSATDLDSGRTDIEVTWDHPGGEGVTYNIYRSPWEEDGEYELVGSSDSTSFVYEQTWEADVSAHIGPTPALAPKGDMSAAEYDEAKIEFINALIAYREMALPYLFDFKAPAYFKVEACRGTECADMSGADQGRAEYIHTEEFSEIAQHVIPSWGYPQLLALADAPSGASGLNWCGLDVCGPGGGIVMGRVAFSGGQVAVDVFYEDYTEAIDAYPSAYFLANGELNGLQGLIDANNNVFTLAGDFTIDLGGVGPIDMAVYVDINAEDPDTGEQYHSGYATITYKGETYSYSLPLNPVDASVSLDAEPIEPIVPVRTDRPGWSATGTEMPLPLAEDPPGNNCGRNADPAQLPLQPECPDSQVAE